MKNINIFINFYQSLSIIPFIVDIVCYYDLIVYLVLSSIKGSNVKLLSVRESY